MLASSEVTLTNEAKLRSFSEPPISDTVTDCVAKAVRSGGGGGAILEGEGGSGGAAAAICTVSLNVTDLRCAVFVSIAVLGAGAPLASGVVDFTSSRRPVWKLLVCGRGRGGAMRGPCLKRRGPLHRVNFVLRGHLVSGSGCASGASLTH